jgi:hypothetical protein
LPPLLRFKIVLKSREDTAIVSAPENIKGGGDVLTTRYKVKNSRLTEQLEKLSDEDRNRIYEVVETMVKHSQKKI